MTDNEIIKALECCPYQKDCVSCDIDSCNNSPNYIMENARDLINCQKEEIERLTYKIECLLCHATGGKLSKSTYSLKTMECAVNDYIRDCEYETERETKAEAIKEFAEKLKEYINRNEAQTAFFGRKCFISEEAVDNLVKELVGEET